MKTFKVQYDCQVDEPAYLAIHAANTLLKEHNLILTIKDDELQHNGWIEMQITIKNIE